MSNLGSMFLIRSAKSSSSYARQLESHFTTENLSRDKSCKCTLSCAYYYPVPYRFDNTALTDYCRSTSLGLCSQASAWSIATALYLGAGVDSMA